MSWCLTLPPYGVNHSRELAKWPVPHLYKRRESKEWEAYAQSVTEGWQPPTHVPLTVHIAFAVTSDLLRRIDADKWAATVIDGVVGSRYDQWIDRITVTKERVGGESCVAITIQWEKPRKRRHSPR